MNHHALDVLEFGDVVARVAARAGSDLGRAAVLALTPVAELGAVRRELERVGETMAFLERSPEWSPPLVPDARAPLRGLEIEGGVLDPAGLRLLALLLVASRLVHEALNPGVPRDASDAPDTGADTPQPHLANLRARLFVRRALEDTLQGIVDDEGQIRDGASPALRSIRTRLRASRSRIVKRLEAYLSTLPDRIRVPDASVSIREGRYVISIRREGRSEVGGIIHGESGTGATLFVEPPLALRLMSELHDLERDEELEVQRILRDITGRLRPFAADLGRSFEALVDFDSLWARARTARLWDAVVPEVAEPGDGELRIVGGRHPLLLEQELTEKGSPVVPFDLALDPGERAIVVSGPNTGGKTVLLKALGLTHLLTQSGILPPVAAGTRLPLVRDVFADIGDEQSIAQSLSTFSAHLANAVEILEGAGPGALVLMDEMGTGTDPSEGAALARAILETLVERGARAIVTSHLGALKRLDAEGSGIVNASLLFDSRRIAPTYQLEKGRPGRSYGLAIARRLGLSPAVIQRAESYVDSGELEVEALLATLEERERELSALLSSAEADRARAEHLRSELESRERQLDEQERTAENRAREEARQLLMEAREEVEEAIREVRESSEEGTLESSERRARRRVEEAARRQRERTPERPSRPGSPSAANLSPGTRVRVLGSGAKGVVQEVSADRITVEVGAVRLQLPVTGVERVGAASGAAAGRQAVKGSPSGTSRGSWTTPESDPSFEADLRGLRVDEVDLELGRALDAAIVGGLQELRIIHGKGTGALRVRVREFLERDPRIHDFRPGGHGEGGSGVTVALFGEGR
jgi:DNA mismatch repair protein MutS2